MLLNFSCFFNDNSESPTMKYCPFLLLLDPAPQLSSAPPPPLLSHGPPRLPPEMSGEDPLDQPRPNLLSVVLERLHAQGKETIVSRLMYYTTLKHNVSSKDELRAYHEVGEGALGQPPGTPPLLTFNYKNIL